MISLPKLDSFTKWNCESIIHDSGFAIPFIDATLDISFSTVAFLTKAHCSVDFFTFRSGTFTDDQISSIFIIDIIDWICLTITWGNTAYTWKNNDREKMEYKCTLTYIKSSIEGFSFLILSSPCEYKQGFDLQIGSSGEKLFQFQIKSTINRLSYACGLWNSQNSIFLSETLPKWYIGNFFHNRDATFYCYFFGSCDDYIFVCEFEGKRIRNITRVICVCLWYTSFIREIDYLFWSGNTLGHVAFGLVNGIC